MKLSEEIKNNILYHNKRKKEEKNKYNYLYHDHCNEVYEHILPKIEELEQQAIYGDGISFEVHKAIIKMQHNKIKQLEKQIEKMKSCDNCKLLDYDNACRLNYDHNDSIDKCINKNKWELKNEIK